MTVERRESRFEMDSRRIPFITTTYESSESDNDVEPRTRLFRRQKNAINKKDSIAGGGRASLLLPPSTVSLHYFVHGGTEEDEENKYRAFFSLEPTYLVVPGNRAFSRLARITGISIRGGM